MDQERFVIKKSIGTGYFGIAYLAYDKILRKDVALKMIILKGEQEKKAALEEIDNLKYLSNMSDCSKYVVCYYDSFIVSDNGRDILYNIRIHRRDDIGKIYT
jgi:serine/threonine protein kinase